MNASKWLKHLSLIACTTVISGAELIASRSAQAQVIIRNFEPRYQTQTKGKIGIIGNTLMTCDEDNTNLIGVRCPDVQSGEPVFSGNTNLAGNNFFFMNYVDVDSDGSTFNSSSSNLAIPAGATVAWAGLYWSGDLSAGSQDRLTSTPGQIYSAGQPAPNPSLNRQAQLQIPGSSYQTITADNIDEYGGRYYSAYADVTSLVQAAGDGTYTMANVQAGTGGDRYAGWSLIVVYEDPSESLRNLNVYDGFVFIDGPLSTTISGFETPPDPGFEVEFGTVTYEGDEAFTGDQFRLNGTNLSDGLNPADNFFNSSNTRLGRRFTAKNPNYVNELAIDLDIVDATGFLNPGDTSASLEFTTTGDVYFPTAFTFSTEIKQPILTKNFTKTVLDVNGGDTVAGDILEYEITLENTGNETATNVIITDPIPQNTTLVDGSLEVVRDPDSNNIGRKTNAVDDDTAELNGTEAVFRIGTGANATDGGSLAAGESVTVKFQVQIDSQISNTSNISNQASVDFNSGLTGTAFNAVSDDPNTPGQNDATNIRITSPIVCNNREIVELSFQNPQLESGSDLQQGATYRFSDVAAGIDALVMVDRFNNGASLVQIDNIDRGSPDAFQPELRPTANPDSSVDFTISFVETGTNTPVSINAFNASGVDIDGDSGNIREYIELDGFTSYSLENPTSLTATYNDPTGRFESTTTATQPGISLDATQTLVTGEFTNASSFRYRIGALNSGTSITNRLNSLSFNCLSFNNPQQNVTTPVDYGDLPADGGTAPDGSGTTGYGEASHIIVSGIQLGASIDAETAAQNSANADGDDNDGTDDDDAFDTLPNIPSIGDYNLNVPVNTTGNVTLHGWVDFDKDGQFEASEYTSASVTSSGDVPLSWSVPVGTTPGNSYARFRLTSDSLTDDGTSDIDERSIGSASDGEVEDYPVTIELARVYDYGDAPDTENGTGTGNYQTTANDDGAAQVVINDPTSGKVLSLGENVDADTGSLENVDALADDEDGTPDDEDGVESFPTLTTAEGQTYTVSVTARNNITEEVAGTQVGVPAYLVGFIDFNKDGDFTDPGERSETVTISSGNSDLRTFDVTFTTPAGMTPGDTYARFRLGQIEATAQSATGASAGTDNGEIEDYKIAIASEPLITGNVCYSVADYNDTLQNGSDTLTKIDRLTGAEERIGDTGTSNIEAIAYSPLNNTLYAVDADQFGRIDTTTGTFTPIGTGVGSSSGDIDGLTVDPYTGQIYGSVRRTNGSADLLIEIDPATGRLIPGAFNGNDSVPIQIPAGTDLEDIDDITIDPYDGQLYGIANKDRGTDERYVRIDRTDGTTTSVGSFGITDVEGLTAFNDGNIYLTTGNRGDSGTNDTFYSVNKASGNSTAVSSLNVGSDYESVACLTGPPNSISGKVFLDSNNNGTNDTESGTENVTVELYRDVNADGTLDSGDILLTTQVTNSDGDYNFLFAATGAYVLAIDPTTLPEGNTLTTDNLETANLIDVALSDTDNDFGHVASPQSPPPPADSCPSSPIGLVDVGVSTVTGSGSGVGRQVRYPNVATVDGKALDLIGEVKALQNMNDLDEFGINGSGLANVTLTDTAASVPINTRKFATIEYTFVETGTTNPVPVSFEFEVSDIDNNRRSSGSSRREYIIFSTSQFQDYFFGDPTQMQAQLDPDGIEFSNSVEFDGNPGPSGLNTVKFLIVNRSSFTITFGVEKNTASNTGRTGFGLDGAILPQLGKCDRYDYGDAPDSDSNTAANNYQTLLANGGPAHKIIDGLFLGPAKPDADNNGTPTASADGDDLSNTNVTFDDEDGVQLGGNELQGQTLEAGESITLDIATQGSGVLNAWMDWNNDGDFQDADEKIATNAVEGGAGDSDNNTPGIQLNFTVPSGATAGNTFARFRYSTDADLEPTGTANDGEVEDYQVAIAAASDPNLLLVKRITAINPESENEVEFNSFVNDDSNNDGDFDNDPDNDPNWPDNDDIYLRGATTVNNVRPGDEVEYTIYFLSNGDEEATNVKICDVIPDNMSFVPHSYDGGSGIALLNSSASSATSTNLTNSKDGDEGTFYAPGTAPPTVGNPPVNLCQKVDSAGNTTSVGAAQNINGAIVVEIDSLPEATAPGTPVNSYGFIRFRAKVQ